MIASSLAIQLCSLFSCCSTHVRIQNKKAARIRAAHSSETNLCENALSPHPKSLPDEGGAFRDAVDEIGRVLVHAYATAWAGSFVRLRFIPVTPGSKKWTLPQVDVHRRLRVHRQGPTGASTRPTTWSCSVVLM